MRKRAGDPPPALPYLTPLIWAARPQYLSGLNAFALPRDSRAGGIIRPRANEGETAHDDRRDDSREPYLPGRGVTPAASHGACRLYGQGHLPARADLERVGR